MSYFDPDLNKKVLVQDAEQIQQSTQKARESRERKEKQDYETASAEYNKEVKAEEERFQKEKEQYEKDLAVYEADQAKLKKILEDPIDMEAKRIIDSASDRHGAVFNYRDTDYVRDYLGLDIPTPISDTYRKQNTNKSGTFIGQGSELNRSLNEDKFYWLGGSQEQWKSIIAKEDADRKLSQEQSKYLRAQGNLEIQRAQKTELERLGNTGTLNTQGPTLISATLTKPQLDGYVRPERGIPVAPGIAQPSQPDFSKGYTLESKLMGFIPSSDIPKLQQQNAPRKSFEERSQNVLSLSQQTTKAQSSFGILSNAKEEFHIGNEKQYFFDGKEVKDKSAQRLIDFQQGLKTTKRPSATIYKGILQESNLPVTPLATKIIDTLSSKGTFLGFSEVKQAKGKLGTYTDKKTGASFSLETGLGGISKADVDLARNLGFEVKDVDIISKFQQSFKSTSSIPGGLLSSIVKESGATKTPQGESILSDLIRFEKPVKDDPFLPLDSKNPSRTAKYTLNKSESFDAKTLEGSNRIAQSLGFVQKTEAEIKAKQSFPKFQTIEEGKPTTFNQALESSFKTLDKLQSDIQKSNPIASGLVTSHVLELGKMGLSTIGFFTSSMEQYVDPFIEKQLGLKKTARPLPLRLGVAADEVVIPVDIHQSLQSKSIVPKSDYFGDVYKYSQKYGVTSVQSGIGVYFLPVPLGKVELAKPFTKLRSSIPSSIKTPVSKVAENISDKLRLPTVKNQFDNIIFNLEGRKNMRTVKAYALSRANEGIFGIEKISSKTFVISRGLEESAKKVSGYSEKTIVGFEKKKGQLIPIESEVPQKQIFPRPQVNSPLAELTIINFQKRKPTFVTDIFSPSVIKQPTLKTDRFVSSSLDPEFYRTAKTLGMQKVKQGIYDLRKPTVKQTTEFYQKEKEELLSLVAIGKTAKLKDVKVLSKFERLKRTKQKPFSYIGKDAIVTRFYETPGMGLGKGKGFIERIKSPDFISVGSRDMDRMLERAGLGPKREIKFETPYDTSQYKIFGTGSGKAQSVLSEQTKTTVKASSIQEIKKAELNKIPNLLKTDYLQQRDTFKPKYDYIQSDNIIEYGSFKFPEIQTPKIEIKLNDLVIPKQQTKTQTRTETKEIQKIQPLQIQKPVLSNALVSRQAIRNRQRERVKQVPRLAIKAIEIPRLNIKSLQSPKLRERQLMKTPQLLKQRTTTRPRDPERTTRRPPKIIPIWWNDDTKKKKSKDEKSEINFFLGNVPETQISGIFKRKEITLGEKKIEKTRKGDVRVLAGKPRKTSRKKQQYDLLGFKKGKKGSVTKFF